MSSTGAFKGGPASHTGPHFVSYNQTVETWEVVPEPEPTPEEPTPEENVMSQSRLEFYATNSQGEIVRYDVRNDVHPGYTHILTSPFGSGWTNIFAYDAALGQADIWKRTDQGETILVSSTTSLRKGATLVVEARLTGTKLDVVLYDAPKGELDIYQVDQGQVTLAKTITGMKTSWTHVVRGNYDCGNYDCLFFYDAAIGRGGGLEGRGELAGRLDHLPAGRAVGLMARDAGVHFGVQRLGGDDDMHGKPAVGRGRFGEAALARTGAAEDQFAAHGNPEVSELVVLSQAVCRRRGLPATKCSRCSTGHPAQELNGKQVRGLPRSRHACAAPATVSRCTVRQ